MKIQKSKTFPKQSGLTLIELMITVAITGFMVAVINAQFSHFYRIFGNVTLDAEIQEISSLLRKTVNCDKTLKSINLNELGATVQLLDKNARPILKGHTLGGVAQPYKIAANNWLANVTWTGQSLAVNLAKLNPDNSSWAKDPITGEILDMTSPRTKIFSDPPSGIPLCPRSSYQSVLEERISTTSGVINPLVGVPDTDPISPMLRRPILLMQACHKFCRNEGYTAGRFNAGGDSYGLYDSEGNYTGQENYEPGKSWVLCGCFP